MGKKKLLLPAALATCIVTTNVQAENCYLTDDLYLRADAAAYDYHYCEKTRSPMPPIACSQSRTSAISWILAHMISQQGVRICEGKSSNSQKVERKRRSFSYNVAAQELK